MIYASLHFERSVVGPLRSKLDALSKKLTRKITLADLQYAIRIIHAAEDTCSLLWNRTSCPKRFVSELYRKIDALELRIAGIFGAQHGWRLAKKHFAWNALLTDDAAERFPHELYHSLILCTPPCCDHPIFYCDLDGKPAAILGQEYRFYKDEKQKDCEQFAAMTGLAFELPDFVSWYSQYTTLVLWRRAE